MNEVPVNYKDEQEWAIRDEVTGEWWTRFGCVSLDPAKAYRFETYRAAAAALVRDAASDNDGASRVRIVPAPLREMIDDECWTWLTKQGPCWSISPRTFALSEQAGGAWSGEWACTRYTSNMLSATGATPCDAIRAARRALEKK